MCDFRNFSNQKDTLRVLEERGVLRRQKCEQAQLKYNDEI